MLTAIFDQLGRDLGYALRQVRHNPGFSAVAIATLALGIGVNTAMFSAVDAVLIRPLPYADSDRLLMVWDDNSRVGDSAHFFSTPAEWFEWRRHNTVFTDIAATQPGDAALSGAGEPEELPARKVTGNFWNVLGARPLLGRTFTEDEDARGDRVVVISHGLWQRRFGASPGVVGQTITLNDNPYQVVGVMLQTFQHLRTLDLGIRSERLLTVLTPLFRYPDFDRRVAFVNAQLEQIRAIPGVTNAGAISRVPLTVNDQATFYRLASQSRDEARDQVALSRVVTGGYFATVGAQLREGRFFETSDRRSDAPAAIVNETFANRHFPGRSPLGERFQFGTFGPKAYVYGIVGVVKEIRDRGVAEELRPTIYRLHEQADQSWDQPSGIVIRTSVEPTSIVAAVRQAIWSVDKNQPVARVQTIDDIVTRQLSVPSQNTTLLSAFALLALVLASLGLYGVLSYTVTQRPGEIGVRMALGATARNILLSFSRRGLALTVAGLAIGLVLTMMVARAITTLFYGFQPDFVGAVAVAAAVLLTVAALACLVPARRASRINPTVVLQHE